MYQDDPTSLFYCTEDSQESGIVEVKTRIGQVRFKGCAAIFTEVIDLLECLRVTTNQGHV
jgi:hypothetical protein